LTAKPRVQTAKIERLPQRDNRAEIQSRSRRSHKSPISSCFLSCRILYWTILNETTPGGPPRELRDSYRGHEGGARFAVPSPIQEDLRNGQWFRSRWSSYANVWVVIAEKQSRSHRGRRQYWDQIRRHVIELFLTEFQRFAIVGHKWFNSRTMAAGEEAAHSLKRALTTGAEGRNDFWNFDLSQRRSLSPPGLRASARQGARRWAGNVQRLWSSA